MLDSGTAKSKSEEYTEYKTAYDAYHSENGESLIEDEEFLMLHNRTMYVGAKDEYIRKRAELYNAMSRTYGDFTH